MAHIDKMFKVVHNLKIETVYFEQILLGVKTAEIRYNDRDYKVGDIIQLEEYSNGKYTGRYFLIKVLSILSDTKYLQSGYVMLSFEKLMKEDII